MNSIDDKGLVYELGQTPRQEPRKYYSTGFPELDAHWKLCDGQFIVVGSKPGTGKTTFLAQLASNVANSIHNVGIMDFETGTDETERRMEKLFIHRIPASKPNREVLAKGVARGAILLATFDYLKPGDDPEPNLAYILEIIRVMAVSGAKIVIIDPWNEMDHWREHGESLTEYTGRAIKSLKHAARRHKVAIIVAAHPAKPLDYSKPIESLYQISDSAHWFNKPDIGILLNRAFDEKTGKAGDELYVNVSKVRFQHAGFSQGEIILRFDRQQWRFVSATSSNEGVGATRRDRERSVQANGSQPSLPRRWDEISEPAQNM